MTIMHLVFIEGIMRSDGGQALRLPSHPTELSHLEKITLMISTAWRAPVAPFGILTCSLSLIIAASAQGQSANPDRSQAQGSGQARAEDSPSPAAQPAIVGPRGVPPATGSTGGDACNHCGRPGCLGRGSCRFDPKTGFFALGQPHQYVPPPSGWTTIVPPIPRPTPPPKPGEKPKPTPP